MGYFRLMSLFSSNQYSNNSMICAQCISRRIALDMFVFNRNWNWIHSNSNKMKHVIDLLFGIALSIWKWAYNQKIARDHRQFRRRNNFFGDDIHEYSVLCTGLKSKVIRVLCMCIVLHWFMYSLLNIRISLHVCWRLMNVFQYSLLLE